ncbi:hypothetical protein RQP46_010306 [Phenoliferia psychrophenolica]
MSQQYQPNFNHTQPPTLAGNRISCETSKGIPPDHQFGLETGCHLTNNRNRGFLGSAYAHNCIIPCRVFGPWIGSGQCEKTGVANAEVRYGHGGKEYIHTGRFDFLGMSDEMEWVTANHGAIPAGRTPVLGGRDVNGDALYHALAVVGGHYANDCDGHRVLGKTGTHLPGALIGANGPEHVITTGYQILCWKAGRGALKAAADKAAADKVAAEKAAAEKSAAEKKAAEAKVAAAAALVVAGERNTIGNPSTKATSAEEFVKQFIQALKGLPGSTLEVEGYYGDFSTLTATGDSTQYRGAVNCVTFLRDDFEIVTCVYMSSSDLTHTKGLSVHCTGDAKIRESGMAVAYDMTLVLVPDATAAHHFIIASQTIIIQVPSLEEEHAHIRAGNKISPLEKFVKTYFQVLKGLPGRQLDLEKFYTKSSALAVTGQSTQYHGPIDITAVLRDDFIVSSGVLSLTSDLSTTKGVLVLCTGTAKIRETGYNVKFEMSFVLVPDQSAHFTYFIANQAILLQKPSFAAQHAHFGATSELDLHEELFKFNPKLVPTHQLGSWSEYQAKYQPHWIQGWFVGPRVG